MMVCHALPKVTNINSTRKRSSALNGQRGLPRSMGAALYARGCTLCAALDVDEEFQSSLGIVRARWFVCTAETKMNHTFAVKRYANVLERRGPLISYFLLSQHRHDRRRDTQHLTTQNALRTSTSLPQRIKRNRIFEFRTSSVMFHGSFLSRRDGFVCHATCKTGPKSSRGATWTNRGVPFCGGVRRLLDKMQALLLRAAQVLATHSLPHSKKDHIMNGPHGRVAQCNAPEVALAGNPPRPPSTGITR